MHELQFVKLGIDLLLVGSLIYLGVRFFKASAIQTGELEASLRQLLREAENSSNSLSTELQSRHAAMRKLLLEVESAERELARARRAAVEEREELGRAITKAQRGVVSAPSATQPQPVPTQFEPPSFKNARTVQATIDQPIEQTIVAQATSEREREAPPFGQGAGVNIFGEPIGSSSMPATPPSTALTKQLEREVVKKPARMEIEREIISPAEQKTLDDVYAAAERLIREGHDLAMIAAETSLGLDEVRMLREIVIREDAQAQMAEPNPGVSDGRLGALGGMKRTVTTL